MSDIVENKIKQLTIDMNIQLNNLSIRQKQILAQDISRKIRITKKEVMDYL